MKLINISDVKDANNIEAHLTFHGKIENKVLNTWLDSIECNNSVSNSPIKIIHMTTLKKGTLQIIDRIYSLRVIGIYID